jgi:protein O-mannosyl-transferase
MGLQPERRGDWPYVVGLLVVVCGVFSSALGGEFLDWDDDLNFTRNLDYRGLGWSNIRWAFSTFLVGVYQPLAWLLLELQYALFALRPFGYHLTSLCLHGLNTVLVYRLIERLLALAADVDVTPAPFLRPRRAAAFAALLWGLHPLRTEAIAWASCQPYLLCAAFVLLAALAHLNAAAAAAAGGTARARRWRLATLALYLAALLSKAEAIMLPAALLVLDVYPLRRLGGVRGWRSAAVIRSVWLEKLPLAAVAAVFAAVTVHARQVAEHLPALEKVGLPARLAHAAVSFWFYLGKTLAPGTLSPYYALPADLKNGSIGAGHVAAGLAAVVVTAAVLRGARRFPALAAAWMVYLAFLLPHAGLLRISSQLGADRYTYLSSIGFAAALAAGLRALAAAGDRLAPAARKRITAAVAGTLLFAGGALAVLADRQVSVWASTEKLWSSAYEDPGNRSSHVANNWGSVLLTRGRWDEAAGVLQEAVRLSPTNAKAFHNLSSALLRLERVDEALAAARQAVTLRPGSALAHLQVGIILAARRDPAAAQAVDRAVELAPADAKIWAQRGQVQVRLGNRPAAEQSLARAATLAPASPEVAALRQELR